jgi:hypothetical protein
MSMTPSGAYTSWKDWLIAALFAVAFAVCGYAFAAVDERFKVDESRLKEIEVALPNRAERIRAVEVRMEGTDKVLVGINEKLDRLIQLHMSESRK